MTLRQIAKPYARVTYSNNVFQKQRKHYFKHIIYFICIKKYCLFEFKS